MTGAAPVSKAATNPPQLPRVLAAVVLLLTLGAPAAHAQDPGSPLATGRVRGVVFDSTSGSPYG